MYLQDEVKTTSFDPLRVSIKAYLNCFLKNKGVVPEMDQEKTSGVVRPLSIKRKFKGVKLS